VLDALPAERFRITGDGPRYLGVGQAQDRLVAVEIAADDALLAAIGLIESDLGTPLPDGYESEFCPGLPSWIERVAGSLAAGVVLFADYGLPRRHYYHPQRSTGTMMCHYRHRAHADPFFWPGLQDITAWVDFTAVAEAGCAAGLTVEGFTSQASFLIGSGIAELVDHHDDPRRQVETAAQIRRLTLPGEMGESFKLIGLGREWQGDLQALSLHDQSGAL
jgi:SAM-dependent MidA family methyltransferase